MPPSLAKANIIRLLLVMLKRPQCQTQTMRPSEQELARGPPRLTHNHAEQHKGAVLAKDVDEDLQNGLAVRGLHSRVQALDGKQEGHQNEKAEEGAEPDTGHDADRSAPGRP